MEIAGILITRELLITMIKKAVEVTPDDIYYIDYGGEVDTLPIDVISFGLRIQCDNSITDIRCNGKKKELIFRMDSVGSTIINNDEEVRFSLHDEEYEELKNLCKEVVLSRKAPAFNQILTDLGLK